MIDEKKLIEELEEYTQRSGYASVGEIMEIVYEQPKIGEWIPVSERLPVVETEVLVLAKIKYIDGTYGHVITTAMYEDGTMLENDSCWVWQDIEGEWDEENDCYIIPEGWWEHRHYNPDDVYNNPVDDEVIAWMPLPKLYQSN